MTETIRRPLLEVTDLTKSYAEAGVFRRKRRQILRGVTFTVDRGEAVALVGESGSGKSTIARQILRLETPDAGTIALDGVDIHKAERRPTLAFRRKVQMVFQDPFGSLNPRHTIGHHIVRPLVRHGRARSGDARTMALALLNEVGLVPAEDYLDKLPHALSGGQRQRVAIARAFAPSPDLVIADEPTSMLDVSLRMGVLNLLTERKRKGLALVLITHDLASARYLADRILVLYGGVIMEEADADTLVTSPSHPYTQLLLSAADRSSHRAAPPSPKTPRASPTGCPFSTRCGLATAACDVAPPRIELAPDHFARCHALAASAPQPARETPA